MTIRKECFLSFEELEGLSLGGIKNKLDDCPKCDVGTMSFSDLAQLPRDVGVYVFYDNQDNCMYVGKASSRCFMERFGGHFDRREEAWMNSYPRAIRKHDASLSLDEALAKAFNTRVLFIGFLPEGDYKKRIGRFERILRQWLRPYNRHKRDWGWKPEEFVKDKMN